MFAISPANESEEGSDRPAARARVFANEVRENNARGGTKDASFVNGATIVVNRLSQNS
jgi:L-serine deaminase